MTRGIDEWVWPLSMPNYTLHPKVLQARHALSLDDERDTFHPLLWERDGGREPCQRGTGRTWTTPAGLVRGRPFERGRRLCGRCAVVCAAPVDDARKRGADFSSRWPGQCDDAAGPALPSGGTAGAALAAAGRFRHAL